MALPAAQGAHTPAVLDCPGRQGQLVAALHTCVVEKEMPAVGMAGQLYTSFNHTPSLLSPVQLPTL